MIYGYIRVSTDKQTTENQMMAIKNFCRQKRLHNINWISETISGTKSVNQRQLGNLLNQVQENDIIIITEISRLGRSMIMILNILQELLEKKVKVYAIKEGYELGDNIQSKVLAFAFGLSAEIERQLISERTKSGLERVRKSGKHIGRKKGQKSKVYKLDSYKNFINQELINGRSKNSIATELNVSWSTLNESLKRWHCA